VTVRDKRRSPTPADANTWRSLRHPWTNPSLVYAFLLAGLRAAVCVRAGDLQTARSFRMHLIAAF